MKNLNFRNRISIVELKPSPGPEPGGEEEVIFTKAWADIKTMKGSEYNIASLSGNVGKSRFIIRYMEGIKPYMKINFKGKQYNIISITNDDELNQTITIIGEAIL